MSSYEDYIHIPVPLNRVQDVYRLLGGEQEDVRPAWEDVFEDPEEEPAEAGRKAPQCRATRTINGEKKRCQRGPRHTGQRHQWKAEE